MTVFENIKNWFSGCPELAGRSVYIKTRGECGVEVDMLTDHRDFRRYVRGRLRELSFTVELHVPMGGDADSFVVSGEFFDAVARWLDGAPEPELGDGRFFCDMDYRIAPQCVAIDDHGCAVYRQRFNVLFYEKEAA